MIFLPLHCQMARAAVGWGVRELAAAAKVSIDTLARFERGDALKERTVDAIQNTLEAAGVQFISEDGEGGPGVRLRKGIASGAQAPASVAKRTPRTQETSRKSTRPKRR